MQERLLPLNLRDRDQRSPGLSGQPQAGPALATGYAPVISSSPERADDVSDIRKIVSTSLSRVPGRFFKPITLLLFFLSLASLLHAQGRVVTGTVADANGAPLGGVSVIIKGSTSGTTTASGIRSVDSFP